MKQSLYRWQSECIDAWHRNDCRGIVSAVTGAGKTTLALSAAAGLMKEHPDLHIRIVAPTIALANQWRQAVIRSGLFGNERPGFYGDGIRDDSDCRIMIYVVNSARTSLAGHMRKDFALGRPALLICDECHRYKSKENYRIFDFMHSGRQAENSGQNEEAATSSDYTEISSEIAADLYYSLGLSATPFNGDRDSLLVHALGKEIYSYGFDHAVREGTVAPYTICQVAAGFLPDELEKYGELSDAIRIAYIRLLRARPYLKAMPEGAFIREVRRLADSAGMDPQDPAALFLLLTYQRKDISVMAETRTRCCMRLLESLRSRGRIIIFSERIDQAEAIYRQIARKYGSVTGIYHSGMTREAKARVLQQYRDNRLQILVSCKCLDEGLDVPDAAIGIVLSSSAVPRQRVQRLGRVIRKSEGKDYAVLYYIYVRESSEDALYLKGADADKIYDIRYYSREDVFSNDLYEYAAGELLSNARVGLLKSGSAHRSSENNSGTIIDKREALHELRRCILEGLILPDYLQPSEVLDRKIREARSVHKRNYYMTMRRISEYYKG